MVNLFILYWSRQTVRQKATIIILGLLIVTILFIGSQKAYYKYKYFKEVELQRNDLINTVKQKDLKIDTLLIGLTNKTVQVKEKSKSIKTKLKKDVEEINNSTVTDKQLLELLAKYD